MEMQSATKVSAFNRLGGKPAKSQICKYWLVGRCNRNPCRFLHREPETVQQPQPAKPHNYPNQPKKHTWRKPNCEISNTKSRSSNEGSRPKGESDQNTLEKRIIQQAQPKQCKYWVTNNCVHGEKCKDLHSWFAGSGFTLLGKLEGHKKAISGIALLSSYNKLYTSSKDGTLRVWNCSTAECTGSVELNGEVGCLASEDQWLYAGLHNTVKAWNLQTQTEFTLDGPVGHVCSIVIDKDKVFAGMEDGTIIVWKWNSESNTHEGVCTLKAHNSGVGALIIGAGRLYSGSKDCTIKAWDLQNLQYLQTLHGHTSEITSLLCWDEYLLSASRDKTLKIWHASESGAIGVAHEIQEQHEMVSLCGIHDAEGKPILLCSFSDCTVGLYDLPSFSERGRIFSKCPVQVIQVGVDEHFFTGDTTGDVSVWKLLAKPCAIDSTSKNE